MNAVAESVAFHAKLTKFQTMQDLIGRAGLMADAKDAAKTDDIHGLIFIMNMAEGKRGSDSRLLIESIEFGNWLAAKQ